MLNLGALYFIFVVNECSASIPVCLYTVERFSKASFLGNYLRDAVMFLRFRVVVFPSVFFVIQAYIILVN